MRTMTPVKKMDMMDKKTADTQTMQKRIIGRQYKAVIMAIAVIMVLSGIGFGSYAIYSKHNDSVSSVSSVPDNPRKSATTWLIKLMTTTSSKFGTDFFDSDSSSLSKLMSGDSSFIPASIKNSIHLGSTSDDMTVSRTTLNGSAYAGLIMFSNAYKQTKEKKITTNGYQLSSYDADEQTVYIPAQAIMSTTQEIQFEVKWNGTSWQLQGDPLGWSVYVMLENNASSSSSSSK